MTLPIGVLFLLQKILHKKESGIGCERADLFAGKRAEVEAAADGSILFGGGDKHRADGVAALVRVGTGDTRD